MKFPNESYNLTTVDFSRMKGFSPREVFKKIFVSSGRYSLLDYSLSEIETKYQGKGLVSKAVEMIGQNYLWRTECFPS